MIHIATLISNPAAPVLTQGIVRQAAKAFGVSSELRWLAPAIAAEIAFELPVGGAKNAAERLRTELEGRTIDIVVQRAEGRRKKLLLADMDSTIIGQECVDELASEIGKREHIAAITKRAMEGEIAFAPALRERVALLKGLSRPTILAVIEKRITLTPGALTLVRTMRAHGAYTALVSGGFSIFTSAIAKRLGFDEYRANELLFGEDRTLTGLVAEPVLGEGAKLAVLEELRARLSLQRDETLAIGDGANDLPCSTRRALALLFMRSPRWRRPRRHESIMVISPRFFTPRAIRAMILSCKIVAH